eukprot:6028557-Amphidinium_carterae.2
MRVEEEGVFRSLATFVERSLLWMASPSALFEALIKAAPMILQCVVFCALLGLLHHLLWF